MIKVCSFKKKNKMLPLGLFIVFCLLKFLFYRFSFGIFEILNENLYYEIWTFETKEICIGEAKKNQSQMYFISESYNSKDIEIQWNFYSLTIQFIFFFFFGTDFTTLQNIEYIIYCNKGRSSMNLAQKLQLKFFNWARQTIKRLP